MKTISAFIKAEEFPKIADRLSKIDGIKLVPANIFPGEWKIYSNDPMAVMDIIAQERLHPSE